MLVDDGIYVVGRISEVIMDLRGIYMTTFEGRAGAVLG